MRSATALALIALSAIAGAQSVTLRYKFKAGEVHSYTSNMAMDMKMKMGASSYPTNTNMIMDMSQRVLSVARDGSGTIRSSMSIRGGTVNGQSSPAMNSADGKSFTMKMSPLGKVSNISGSAVSATTQGFDPSQMQMASAFPAGSVHVGSHWTNVTTIPKLGSITMHFTLASLKSVGGSQIATIKSTGMMDLGKIPNVMGAAGQGMHMTGSENMNITVKFNVTHGYMEETDLTGRMMMNMSMHNPNAGKMQNMSMSGTQKMTMRVR